MEAAGGAAREMDAMQFGDLAHDVLKQFGEDKDARRWTDAAKIAQWFEDCLWQSAKQRFGSRPQPLVRLQVESVEQRLKKHAEVEAEQRQMGWEIVAVEMKLGEEESNALLINGARFTGKADRIEHNSVTGERRVLDFKTSDKRANPREKHCAKIKPERLDEADHWKTFSLAGEEGAWIWKDVQLPLYAAALKHHPLGPVTQAGYACLPKAVMETQLELWEGFDERWSEAALACAAEVVRRIREGVFWPPKL